MMRHHPDPVLLALALTVAIAVAGCANPGQLARSPDSFATVIVETSSEVAAAAATVRYDPRSYVYSAIRSSVPSLLAVAHDDRVGRVDVGLISSVPVTGALVEIVFGVVGHAGGIELESFAGYDLEGEPQTLGEATLRRTDGSDSDPGDHDAELRARDLDRTLRARGVRVLGLGGR